MGGKSPNIFPFHKAPTPRASGKLFSSFSPPTRRVLKIVSFAFDFFFFPVQVQTTLISPTFYRYLSSLQGAGVDVPMSGDSL